MRRSPAHAPERLAQLHGAQGGDRPPGTRDIPAAFVPRQPAMCHYCRREAIGIGHQFFVPEGQHTAREHGIPVPHQPLDLAAVLCTVTHQTQDAGLGEESHDEAHSVDAPRWSRCKAWGLPGCAPQLAAQKAQVDLLVGVIGGAHQRPACHAPEPQ